MVKKIKFKDISGYTIAPEVEYKYDYPEDWEMLMDPEDYFKHTVSNISGYVVYNIVYYPDNQELIFYCMEGTYGNRNN